MQFRTDAKNGNELSALGFGCMRFPSKGLGSIDEEATEHLILDALESGVNYFDTAYLYPGSEEVLGRIMARNGIRNRMKIATKLPQYLCKKASDLDKYLDISLKRLQTEFVDYYLLHNVTTYSQWENLLDLGIVEWVREKKEAGTITSLGFSFHGSFDEFEKLLGAYDWDFVQIQYNYANVNYQAGAKGLQMAARRSIPVFIMEPLLGGKLADGLPKKAQGIFARHYDADPVTASVRGAFQWLWDQPEVTMVLSGMNAARQLEENVETASAASAGMLGAEEQDMFDDVLRIFRESYRVPCTGCNYCMPCPKGINIPALFACYNNSYSTSWASGVWGYFISCGALSDDSHFASDCIKCGKCARHCPQKIDIPGELASVRRRLQPPLAKGIMHAASKLRG